MAAAKKKRFTMDTAAFVTIWRNHLNPDKTNDWRTFVLAVFERFTTGNETSNQETLTASHKTWRKWTDDAKYDFLSEKVYSKAIIIKRNLQKAGHNVELPDGYLNRKGTSRTRRLTTDDIWNIFEGDKK